MATKSKPMRTLYMDEAVSRLKLADFINDHATDIMTGTSSICLLTLVRSTQDGWITVNAWDVPAAEADAVRQALIQLGAERLLNPKQWKDPGQG